MARGMTLFTASEPSEHVYFSQGPLISLEHGNQIEIAVIGSEGLVGWPAMVGCPTSRYDAVVRGKDGELFRVRADRLQSIAQNRPSVGVAILRFANVVSVQMAETIGAHALHRVDMRVARWLLLRHDRVGGDEIIVQHDELARNLGARRASVTDCLHVIEGDGLVRCRRGRILVRDRGGLEDLAAGCYGEAESFYREVIGWFGKSVPREIARSISVGATMLA